MPEGAEKGKGVCLCPSYQSGQSYLVELLAVVAQKAQYQSLYCDSGNIDTHRKASTIRSLGRVRHQNQLQTLLGNHLLFPQYRYKALSLVPESKLIV